MLRKERLTLYLTLTTALILLLGSSIYKAPGVANRQPGVEVGDWFKYELVYASLDSNIPDAEFPPDFIKLVSAIITTITIQEVNGKNVTYTMTFEYSNGTIDEETRVVNVETGDGNGSIPIIAKNLNVDDPIYVGHSWNIKECYPRAAAKSCRETVGCYVSYETEHYGIQGSETFDIIWDRQKGGLISMEWDCYLSNATHYYYGELEIELIETNCWYPRKPGVFSGDWTKYSNFQLAVIDTNLPEDIVKEALSYFITFNETEWMLNEIEDIEDVSINYTQMFHYKNGTEETLSDCETDVVCGDYGNPLFLARYLNVSDLACTSIFEWFLPYINYTTSKNVLGVTREICVSKPNFYYSEEEVTVYGNATFVWDRATGILINGSAFMHMDNTTHYLEFSFGMNLNNTNLWGTHTHIVTVAGQEFEVVTFSNTTVMNVTVDEGERALIFNVRSYGNSGFCNVTIPKSMMRGQNWIVYIDGIPLSEAFYSITEDSENTYIYIEYPLSSHEVKIISEKIVPELHITFLCAFIVASTLTATVVPKIRR